MFKKELILISSLLFLQSAWTSEATQIRTEEYRKDLCERHLDHGRNLLRKLEINEDPLPLAPYYGFHEYCIASLAVKPEEGIQLAQKIVKNITAQRSHPNRSWLDHSCIEALFACRKTDILKVFLNNWVQISSRPFGYEEVKKFCKTEVLGDRLELCSERAALQEAFGLSSKQLESLENELSLPSVFSSLKTCRDQQAADFDFNSKAVVWVKIQSIKPIENKQGLFVLEADVVKELVGKRGQRSVKLVWPYFDFKDRGVRALPKVGDELIVPLDENFTSPNFAQCLIIATQENASSWLSQVPKTLLPYSQKLCQKADSIQKQPWLSVRSRTVDIGGVRSKEQQSIRFAPSRGAYVEAASNAIWGEAHASYKLVKTDCTRNYLVIEFHGWENGETIIYSTLDGKILYSASDLKISPDGQYALGFTHTYPSDDINSNTLQLISLGGPAAKVLWDKGRRPLYHDPSYPLIFDRDTIRFRVRHDAIYENGMAPEEAFPSSEETAPGQEFIQVQCRISTSTCTEKRFKGENSQ